MKRPPRSNWVPEVCAVCVWADCGAAWSQLLAYESAYDCVYLAVMRSHASCHHRVACGSWHW